MTPDPLSSPKITILSDERWLVYYNLLAHSKMTNEQKIALLKKNNISVNLQRQSDLKSLLTFACHPETFNQQIITFLLNLKETDGLDEVNVDLTDNQGQSAIYLAVHFNESLSELLIERSHNVNYYCEQAQYSLLYAAAQQGQSNTVRLLKEKGANINFGTSDGMSPLYTAAQAGEVTVVRYLLRHGAAVDSCTVLQETPLLAACDFGKKLNVQLTVKKMQEYRTVIELLLQHQANVNHNSHNCGFPLFRVAINASADNSDIMCDIMSLLVNKHRADINLTAAHNGCTILNAVLSQINPNVKIVLHLISLGADVNQAGTFNIQADNKSIIKVKTYPLHMAIYRKLTDVAIQLIKNKAIVDCVDESGSTPLALACQYGLKAIAQLLLERGADPNACGKDNMPPLMIACLAGHIDIVYLLLANTRTDVNKPGKDNETILFLAVIRNNLNLVIKLCKLGATVNTVRNDKSTPLLFAAQEGNHDIVQVLLDNGADMSIARSDGVTPLFLAFTENHISTVYILVRHHFTQKFNVSEFRQFDFKILADVLLPGDIRKLVIVPTFKEAIPLGAQSSTLFASQETNVQQKIQGVHAYLTQQGFSKETIAEMRKKNKVASEQLDILDNFLQKTERSEENKVVTWCDGAITAEMSEIKKINDEGKKTPNCYFYLAKENLLEQSCDNIEIFEFAEYKFCAQEMEQGIRKIDMNKKTNREIGVQLPNGEKIVCLEHEIKIKKAQFKKQRVLCFSLLSDDNRATLIVGAIYKKKGMHTKSDSKESGEATHFMRIHFPMLTHRAELAPQLERKSVR